jgi:hypothetical protein
MIKVVGLTPKAIEPLSGFEQSSGIEPRGQGLECAMPLRVLGGEDSFDPGMGAISRHSVFLALGRS